MMRHKQAAFGGGGNLAPLCLEFLWRNLAR